MFRKKIPAGTQIPVEFTQRDCEIIREHTFYDPYFISNCKDNKPAQLLLSLDQIEEIQEYIAAEANHCEDRNLENEFDKLHDKLQVFLDSHEEE